MVEIVPSGTEYVPGPGNRTDMIEGAHVERTPVHGSFTTPLTITEALAIAEREGWPSGLIDNGPFQVVNVWLEGTQLLELFPADLVGDYLALYHELPRRASCRSYGCVRTAARTAVAHRPIHWGMASLIAGCRVSTPASSPGDLTVRH